MLELLVSEDTDVVEVPSARPPLARLALLEGVCEVVESCVILS